MINDESNTVVNYKANSVVVNHRRGQLAFMPKKPIAGHDSYYQDMLLRMRSLLPTWTEEQPAAAVQAR